jgi:hypothetical protein
MGKLLLKRVGAGLRFGVMTTVVIVVSFTIGGAASGAGAPSPILTAIGLGGFIAWFVLSFLPMMRAARRHAAEDRQLRIECEVRLGMADQERTQEALRKIHQRG